MVVMVVYGLIKTSEPVRGAPDNCSCYDIPPYGCQHWNQDLPVYLQLWAPISYRSLKAVTEKMH